MCGRGKILVISEPQFLSCEGKKLPFLTLWLFICLFRDAFVYWKG